MEIDWLPWFGHELAKPVQCFWPVFQDICQLEHVLITPDCIQNDWDDDGQCYFPMRDYCSLEKIRIKIDGVLPIRYKSLTIEWYVSRGVHEPLLQCTPLILLHRCCFANDNCKSMLLSSLTFIIHHASLPSHCHTNSFLRAVLMLCIKFSCISLTRFVNTWIIVSANLCRRYIWQGRKAYVSGVVTNTSNILLK